ncbi:WD repeat and HMG-box DNA-binding protein 1 [Nymphon striatum]|nr:WD repeat and HMG-box DNA-binding protein 1 [Nymphon striatum]
MESSELRLAHAKGYTDLCYDTSGSFIITGGSNGEVCIWNGIEDNQPSRHKIGQHAHAVAFAEGRFYAATDSYSIQAYTFPDGDNDGIVTRFTSPVTHMCVSDDGEVLVAGSSDFTIKVAKIKENMCLDAVGHDAPILSVAIDSSCQYIASTSCDGSARIWKIDEEITCVQKWNLLPVTSDYTLSETLARPCWMPKTGEQLVIPVEKQLKVFVRDTWEQESTFTHPDIEQMISIAVFHPDGKLLAASCIDGKVFIWNFSSNNLMHCLEHKSKSTICGLVWNPKCNMEIAYADQLGYIGIFATKSEASADMEYENLNPKDAFALLPPDDADEIDEQPSFSKSSIVDDDDDDDEMPSMSRPFRPSLIDDEDSNEFDIGAIKARLEPTIFGLSNVQPEVSNIEKKENVIIRYTGPEISKPQSAFQSGSTPVSYSHRYMKWNSIGIIHAYNTEEENSIDVQFHDTATHHSLHFSNSLNHTLGDVSAQAVVFACPKDENDTESVSKLVCNHFSSWDNNKEWIVDLNENEEFVSICIGEDWIAGATNLRNVRLFTIGGIQRTILSVPGDILTVAGHQDVLAIIYHKSIAIAGDQNLAMALHVVGAGTQRFSLPFDVPLSQKTEISWFGLTDEGSPCLMDSSGILRLLTGKTGHLWVQVIDTKDHTKGKSDHHFVIGVSEIQQELRCIFCKGSRYPATAPRPSLVILPLKIPLCELSTEKSKLEEKYLKQRLLSNSHGGFFKSDVNNEESEEISKLEKESLMKMFALACQVDREFRASEVASLMMASQQLLQLAIKYATKTSKISLAERIAEIAEDRIFGNVKTTLHEYAIGNGVSNHNGNGSQEVTDNDVEDDEVEEMEDCDDEHHTLKEENPLLRTQSTHELISSSPSLSNSSSVKNPFKMQSGAEKKDCSQSVGISAFDSMKKSKVLEKKFGDKTVRLGVNKKATRKEMNQKKVLPTIQSVMKKIPQKTPASTKSGFPTWFEKNKSELAKENPDINDRELTRKAITIFKNLSHEERQKWNNSEEEIQNDPKDLKRKLENGDSGAKSSKQACRQKLTSFMFDK